MTLKNFKVHQDIHREEKRNCPAILVTRIDKSQDDRCCSSPCQSTLIMYENIILPGPHHGQASIEQCESRFKCRQCEAAELSSVVAVALHESFPVGAGRPDLEQNRLHRCARETVYAGNRQLAQLAFHVSPLCSARQRRGAHMMPVDRLCMGKPAEKRLMSRLEKKRRVGGYGRSKASRCIMRAG